MGHLVGDQAQPLAAVAIGTLVVEQELAALADADGEIGQLGGARRRDVGVVDQPLLEYAPGVVDEDGHLLGHREMKIADEDGADSPHGLLVRGHHPRAVRRRERTGLDGDGHDEAATAASRDERHDQEDQQPDVSRKKSPSTFSCPDSYTNCREGEEDFTDFFGKTAIVTVTKNWAANPADPVGKVVSRMD